MWKVFTSFAQGPLKIQLNAVKAFIARRHSKIQFCQQRRKSVSTAIKVVRITTFSYEFSILGIAISEGIKKEGVSQRQKGSHCFGFIPTGSAIDKMQKLFPTESYDCREQKGINPSSWGKLYQIEEIWDSENPKF
jgi:hypothetical protein